MRTILVLGSGGREHALAQCFIQSPTVNQVYVIPGSDGIASIATCIDIDLTDHESIIHFCKDKSVDLVFVGPEAPLSQGIADALNQAMIPVFGPSQQAAQLETSKSFAKEMMKKYHIPTAEYQTFEELNAAVRYIMKQKVPIVIKADGLMAGKGVTVANSVQEAIEALENLYAQNPTGRVVIEEFLEGEECSLMAFVHHELVVPLDLARDYKRVGDHDQGLNTGGMGAYSPVDDVSDALVEKAIETILKPMARAMVAEGIGFTGVLYAGLMVHHDTVKTVEFNVRMGDPETEVLLPRLLTPLDQAILSLLSHNPMALKFDSTYVCGVVLASKGYPKAFVSNQIIEVDAISCPVFHMGSTFKEGVWMNRGGRVLFVYDVKATLKEAKDSVYKAISHVKNDALFYRSDIGLRKK